MSYLNRQVSLCGDCSDSKLVNQILSSKLLAYQRRYRYKNSIKKLNSFQDVEDTSFFHHTSIEVVCATQGNLEKVLGVKHKSNNNETDIRK